MAFYAFVVAATLVVGIALTELFVTLCGAVGVISLAMYVLLERAGGR